MIGAGPTWTDVGRQSMQVIRTVELNKIIEGRKKAGVLRRSFFFNISRENSWVLICKFARVIRRQAGTSEKVR